MQRPIAIAVLTILALPILARGQDAPSPYAANRSEAVKTLTPAEVEGLLAGDGMGLAKPAEMNAFPGPKHVLELADSLGLTPDQAERVESIRAAMKAEAVALGKRVIEGERALDAAFASGTPTEAEIGDLLDRLAADRTALRLAHLKAHLTTTAALDRHQVHEYARLRGYADEVEDGEGAEHVH